MGTVELQNKQKMADGVLLQETGRIIQHMSVVLPKEVLNRLDTDSLKERLYNCLEQNFKRIFSRFLETAEGKNINDSIDADVSGSSPDDIAELLGSYSTDGTFNAADMEDSLIVEAGGGRDLEIYTNSILRHKTDVGAFLDSDNACNVVKCTFRDNLFKPKTVTDVKLCVNIPDSRLINPIFRYYATIRYLIKDVIAAYLIAVIDMETGALEDYQDIDAGKFVDRIMERGAKQDSPGFDLVNIGDRINKSPDIGNIYTRGFAMAINTITSTLEASRMNYQFLEHYQNGRGVVIREYEDTNPAILPDEHYQITVSLLDNASLAEDRRDYDAQAGSFEDKVQHLWDLIEVTYQDSKSVFKVNDFDDLAKKNKSRVKNLPPEWSDVSCQQKKDSVRTRMTKMHERITNMYEFLYPVERRVMEERLAAVEREYAGFERTVNPHMLKPGLVFDVDATSIKQKKTTLDSIAIVLAEFLRNASRGFQDAAMFTFGKLI